MASVLVAVGLRDLGRPGDTHERVAAGACLFGDASNECLSGHPQFHWPGLETDPATGARPERRKMLAA